MFSGNQGFNNGGHMGGSHSSGGYQGGGGRGGRGRGGRGGRGRPNQDQGHVAQQIATDMDTPSYSICTFAVKGSCSRGNCRYDHMASKAFTIPTQSEGKELPVKTLALLQMPDGPKILSGSVDSVVKVWNLSNEKPETDVVSIPATGAVEHIEVCGTNVMWSVDEPISPDQPDNTVGMVYLLNSADMSTLAIKRSEEFPYTHPFGEIRSFSVTIIDGVTFVITAGGEGIIRTWRFDAAKGSFEQILMLEGHIRAVTCVVLNGNFLWSGSVDYTIRVWDLSTGKCAGTLSAIGGGSGHTDAVSCMEYIPNVGAEPLIASGSADCTVKIWNPNGGALHHTCTHSSMVTALRAFRDTHGGIQVLLIGLLEGTIVIRSCVTMKVLFCLKIAHTRTIYSIIDLGQSCFAAGSEEGNINVWKIDKALIDK